MRFGASPSMALSVLCVGVHAPSALSQTAPDEFVVERTFFRDHQSTTAPFASKA